MHYIIDSKDHKLVGMISYSGSGWGLDFTKGVPINELSEEVVVELESDYSSIPDYFELDATPIVSQKMLELIKTLPIDNYQVIPIKIQTPNLINTNHYIINVIGIISCLDMDKSELKLYEGLVMRIVGLVPIAENLQDRDLFRIQEYPLAIVISERVAETIKSNSISGVNILPLEGWSDKHRF